jgi:hypothetical protein
MKLWLEEPLLTLALSTKWWTKLAPTQFTSPPERNSLSMTLPKDIRRKENNSLCWLETTMEVVHQEIGLQSKISY